MADPDASVQVLGAAVVHTPQGLVEDGWVSVRGDRILAVGRDRPAGVPVVDSERSRPGSVVQAPERYAVLCAGFVDIHNHGGGGVSFGEGPEAALVARDAHLRQGTTTVIASLVTDELAVLLRQVEELRPLVAAGELGGIHLEGPWLSETWCGAHPPELLRDPRAQDVALLADAAGDALVMVTLAPERAGARAALELLQTRGVRVAVGHSDATYAQTRAAVEAGVTVATHLYNASRPVHHREPGPVPALLTDPRVWVESVVDGVHLHPAIVRDTADRAGERWVLVSDAMAGALAPDGSYRLGRLEVGVRDGVARLVGADGRPGPPAGSTLSLDRAVRTAVAAGVPLVRAVHAATCAPAAALGLDDVGRLERGRRADLVLLDERLEVRRVMRAGRWVGPDAGSQRGS